MRRLTFHIDFFTSFAGHKTMEEGKYHENYVDISKDYSKIVQNQGKSLII